MIFELLKMIDKKHPFASAAAHCKIAGKTYSTSKVALNILSETCPELPIKIVINPDMEA